MILIFKITSKKHPQLKNTVNCPTTKTTILIKRRKIVDPVKQICKSSDTQFRNKGRESVAAGTNSCGQPTRGGAAAWEVGHSQA
jgi:hypothetical protein